MKYRLLVSVTIFILLAISAVEVMAQGDLLIYPMSVVFDGSRRSQELNIANTGKDTANYNISIIEIKMKDDGSFEQITVPDSGQNFADKNIRFFPRKISLAPNEAQVVKIQLVQTNELTPGEYRSHLYFRSVPVEKPLGDTASEKARKDIAVSLVPVFGISTPVIIRVGENTAAVTLSDVSFEMAGNQTPMLHFSFNRTGNMSVYGDIKVEYISQAGKVTEVKQIKGVAVYTPNTVRHFATDLNNPGSVDYSKGKLRVSYLAQKSKSAVKIAETELALK